MATTLWPGRSARWSGCCPSRSPAARCASARRRAAYGPRPAAPGDHRHDGPRQLRPVRVRIGYALGPHRERTLQVDPWAVVVRHGRWYVLGWSHAAGARRLYRIDRVTSVEVLPDRSSPPRTSTRSGPWRSSSRRAGPTRSRWRSTRRSRRRGGGSRAASGGPRPSTTTSRLTGTTENLDWYASEIAEFRATYTGSSAARRSGPRSAGWRGVLGGRAELTPRGHPAR